PLYKVKRGKTEQYVKDDVELNTMLLKSSLEDASLTVKAGAKPLKGAALEALAGKYVEVMSMIQRFARRYDEQVLEKLIYMPILTAESFDDEKGLAKWVQELDKRLNTSDSSGTLYKASLHKDAAREVPSIKLARMH